VFTVLQNPRFATPGTDGRYPRPLPDILQSTRPVVRFRLDGRSTLTFAVPMTAEMRNLLAARRIVLVRSPGQPTTEWLVANTTDVAGPAGQNAIVVECDPIRALLGDIGIIEQQPTGGRAVINLGGINGLPINYLATFVIPDLVKKGISWIEIGTVDTTSQFDLGFDAQTPLAVINQVAKQAQMEWDLRLDEPNDRYLLDMVDTLNNSVTVVEAREGHNILTLQRQRTRERLYTAIRPIGALIPGTDRRADIGYATWRVIGGTVGTFFELLLEARNGGAGPILEDGQHVGRYMQASDNTYHEILDSSYTNQSVTLAASSASSFGNGTDVMFVLDSSGTLMTDLVSPSGVALYGYSQGTFEGKDLGYRNWVRNPSFTDWVAAPNFDTGEWDATGYPTASAASDRKIKNFPANTTYPSGSILFVRGQAMRFTADITTDGSGAATLGTNVVGPGFSGGSFAVPGDGAIIQPRDGNYPFLWNPDSASFAHFCQVPFGPAVSFSCQADGAQTTTVNLAVKGLPANAVIPAGTRLGTARTIMKTTQADSSGNATLLLSGFITVTDGQSVNPSRPAMPGSGFTWGAPIYGFAIGTGNRRVLGSFPFRAIGSSETVHFSCKFHVHANYMTGLALKPELEIYRGSRANLTTAVAGDFTNTDSNGWVFAYAQGTKSLSSDEWVASIVFPRNDTGSGLDPTNFWWAGPVQVSIGSSRQPAVVGSAATRLFQEGNLALLASRQWPATYTATVAEIESAWGLPPDSPDLALGNFIRLRSSALDLDTLLRIVEIEFDPMDPTNKTLTLDTDPERITRLASQGRVRPVYVNVDVTVVSNQVRETILVSEAPPVAVVGVDRFVIAPGAEAPDNDVALSVVTLTSADLVG
jgi:hypothetical protein